LGDLSAILKKGTSCGEIVMGIVLSLTKETLTGRGDCRLAVGGANATVRLHVEGDEIQLCYV
jgi:hypothetical protein